MLSVDQRVTGFDNAAVETIFHGQAISPTATGQIASRVRWAVPHHAALARPDGRYAWLPPFTGRAVTKPNRIEVIFSAHTGVALELGGRIHDVHALPGGTYV